MSKTQAIIFDLDDTLYVEEDYVRSGFQFVSEFIARRYNRDSLFCFETIWDLHERGVRGNTFDLWLSCLGIDHSVPELVSLYRNHTPQVTPLDGVQELLHSLRGEFLLGLITDGYQHVQQKKIKALCLSDHFDAIVISDALGRQNWKPAPLPYRRALSTMNIEPSQAVYVGDNPAKDFLGARGVGMKSIRFRHSRGQHFKKEPKTSQHEPDMEIVDLHEVRTATVGLLK